MDLELKKIYMNMKQILKNIIENYERYQSAVEI